jgi:hypothetical protein
MDHDNAQCSMPNDQLPMITLACANPSESSIAHSALCIVRGA